MKDKSKQTLIGKSLRDLEQLALQLNQPRFRAKQLYQWLYTRRQTDPQEMTNLAKEFRTLLAESYIGMPLEVINRCEGLDGSIKLLFKLNDGKLVEGVIIPEGLRLTACLSSQVGCNLDCQFCATASLGFQRNLLPGEIVGQLILLENAAGRPMTNVVMMGMGEPLLNRDNLFDAVRLITDPEGMALSRHRFTISTAGWLPGIIAMKDSGLRVKLAVSLNGTTDEQRGRLMPRASRYPLTAIIETAAAYAYWADIRVQFGYLLLEGLNDSDDDARRLVRLLRKIPCKVNVMEYNSIGGEFRRTTPEKTDHFATLLRDANITVTVRTSRGGDINAACGQLAGKAGNSPSDAPITIG